VAEALEEYFKGAPDALSRLDCATAGTRFQERAPLGNCFNALERRIQGCTLAAP
jgi:hypothetical protein